MIKIARNKTGLARWQASLLLIRVSRGKRCMDYFTARRLCEPSGLLRVVRKCETMRRLVARFKTGLARRAFLGKPDIIGYLRESNSYTPDEDLPSADGFILFDSKPLRTWLLATRYRLYSVSDDTAEREPVIYWSISRSRIIGPGGAALPLKTHEDQRGAFLIDIGYRPRNRYSPELFTGADLKEKILRLVEEKLLCGTGYKLS